MTSEEMNRAIEFLLQHQGRMDVQQEKDKLLMQQLAVNDKRLADLLVIESSRLDRADQRLDRADQRLDRADERLDRAEREDRAAQKRHEELMREMHDGIDRILKKLDERPQ